MPILSLKDCVEIDWNSVDRKCLENGRELDSLGYRVWKEIFKELIGYNIEVYEIKDYVRFKLCLKGDEKIISTAEGREDYYGEFIDNKTVRVYIRYPDSELLMGAFDLIDLLSKFEEDIVKHIKILFAKLIHTKNDQDRIKEIVEQFISDNLQYNEKLATNEFLKEFIDQEITTLDGVQHTDDKQSKASTKITIEDRAEPKPPEKTKTYISYPTSKQRRHTSSPKEITDEDKDTNIRYTGQRPYSSKGNDISIEIEKMYDQHEIYKEQENLKELLRSGRKQTIDVTIPINPKPKESTITRTITRRASIKEYKILIPLAKINWELRKIDDEEVYVDKELQSINTSGEEIKEFREFICKIAEIMTENKNIRQIIKICVDGNENRDGINYKGQLYFNILRWKKDDPLRWVVVVARELAYLKYSKPDYRHSYLMTELIIKALRRVHEIYPGLCI